MKITKNIDPVERVIRVGGGAFIASLAFWKAGGCPPSGDEPG